MNEQREGLTMAAERSRKRQIAEQSRKRQIAEQPRNGRSQKIIRVRYER